MARTSDKAAYWAEIIRRYRQSGLTQPQFCRENDISFHSLRWWLHQPRARRAMEALHDASHLKARPGPAHTFLLMVKTLRNQAETPKTASISGVSARQRPGRAANTVRPAHSPRSCKTLELPLLVEFTLPKSFDTNT